MKVERNQQTAQEMCSAIHALLVANGYHVEVVNDIETEDSVVEHVMDLDIVGADFMYNVSLNMNRICTFDEYIKDVATFHAETGVVK